MSETGNLKLKKHDNVETNTEKFDIDNYLNGNWDKIDENVGEVNTNISNINSKSTELEKELKEAQEDFYQNSIRGQASGEYIHVEDSSNCRAKVGISGNSEQETSTQGRNLIIPQDYTETKNGITITSKNGVINVKGTSTRSVEVAVPINKIILKGDYYFSTKITGTVALNNCAIRLFDKNKKDLTKKYFTFETNTQPGFSANMNGTTGYIYIYLNPATVDYYIYPQLEQGTQKNGYEQFTPDMPSPDYPSEIKTVGSNVNIFDKDNTNIKNWYIDTSNKKITSGNSENRILIQEIKPNTTYTISKKLSTFIVATCTNMPTLNSSTTQAQRNDNATKIAIASGSSDKYLVVQFKTQADTLTEQEILDSIKIVEGTEVGEYSKFGQGCVKVTKCNENILDTSITKNVKNQNGEERIGYFCQITKTGKYYLMLNTANTLYFGKSTDLNSATTLIGSTSSTFSTTYNFNEGEYFVLWGTKTEKDKIMVILSNKQQKYIENQEETYIMPVQQEMLEGDYFDWDNEEEVHTWNKLILDGTEDSWLKRKVASEEYRFEFVLSVVALGTNQSVNVICDRLKGVTADATYLKQEGISASTWIQIYLKEFSRDKTVEDFKNWLKEHPLTIYYKLQTPTRLPFTDEQKAVAKELNNARTYKNVTNITTDSIAILDLDYAKDLETLLTSKESEV